MPLPSVSAPFVSPVVARRPAESRAVLALFLVSLLFSLWAVSVGWSHVTLYTNEFRETQTAISAEFIQRENDFSLAYPTPVLGKPWSVPMEFPLYQWTIVVTSALTGLPLAQAGRLISAICFYLCLPALFLLLRRLHFGKTQALVALSFFLTCPLYVHHARGVLIETMALAAGLWYLAALIVAMEQRHRGWLAFAAVAALGAGLVKVTTFIVVLIPAFGFSVWWLWQARPNATRGWKPLSRTLLWLATLHGPAFAATWAWIRFADATKELNPHGAMLTSARLSAFNWGVGHRFDWSTRLAHWQIISHEIVAPVVLVISLVAVLGFARRWWWHAAACLAAYLLVLTIFPVLYAEHSYYHVAAAFFVVALPGFAVAGAFASPRWPRLAVVGLWLVLLGLQVSAYLRVYYPQQHIAGNPPGLAQALQNLVRRDDVFVAAGDDWSSILPYYAQRRALMIPHGDVANEPLLRRSFALLSEEFVGALVLMDSQLDNALVKLLAREYFNLESEPSLVWRDRGRNAAVYFNRQTAVETLAQAKRDHFFAVEVVNDYTPSATPLADVVLRTRHLSPKYQRLFRLMQPQPARFYSRFGPELWHETEPGNEQYSAHPDTKLWFELAPGPHRLRTAVIFVPAAYEGLPAPEASDGVELVAAVIHADGTRAVLHRRYINPRDNPEERPPQPIDWSFDLPAGAEFELSVNSGPHGNGLRDWAALSALRID